MKRDGPQNSKIIRGTKFKMTKFEMTQFEKPEMTKFKVMNYFKLYYIYVYGCLKKKAQDDFELSALSNFFTSYFGLYHFELCRHLF
jgi:hypothetical protein